MGLDATQFTELIRQHSGLIHKVTMAYCADPSAREDVAQEIAVQLWRARDKYDDQYRSSTWVYRIALNVAISCYRRERRHRSGRKSLDEQSFAAQPAEVEVSDEIARLLECINRLGAIDRALVLLYLDGHDHAATADILGTTASNVSTKLHRIKATLKTCLTATTNPPNPPTPPNEHATR